jgi:hypothetical protein
MSYYVLLTKDLPVPGEQHIPDKYSLANLEKDKPTEVDAGTTRPNVTLRRAPNSH